MSEIDYLVEDLGLIPLSSPEAQAVLLAFANRDRFAEMSFVDELSEIDSVRYPNLSEMYYKYNRKGCRRSFGFSFDYQLKLF